VRAPLTAFLSVFVTLPATADTFGSFDWTVSCNADDYCIARTKNPAGMQLKVERSDKDVARLFVTVRAPGDVPLGEGMRVDIDVLDRGFSESETISRVYTGNEMTFSGAADRPLIEALRLGNRGQVTIKFGGTIGTRVYDVSLRGVSTVLADMDRQQGRADRVDAIVLRGGVSVDAGSAPEPMQPPSEEPSPVIAQDDLYGPARYANIVYAESDIPDAVLRIGYQVFSCDFPYVLDGYGAQVIGVTDSLELWMVPCNPADVNVDHYIVFHGGGETDFYEFRQDPRVAGTAGLVVEPRWDNAKRRLTTMSYYGPDGDCGNFATYQYVSEDDAFDLIAFQEKDVCDGIMTLPEQYPMVWTAG